MKKPTELEASYKKYTKDLSKSLPDGIIKVDLDLLHSLNLLNPEGDPCPNCNATAKEHSFYIFESEEKITLVNEKYIVWIVPQANDNDPVTYTFIAPNKEPHTATIPKLELGFSTSGVFNSSSFVLRILEAFLDEIEETDSQLSNFN